MACISKIASAINYDCDTGATGLISALIINKEDIESYTVTAGTEITSLVLAPEAKAYIVDTVKRTTTVSTAIRINDGAPNAYSHTVTLTLMANRGNPLNAHMSNALSNGSFVVLARHAPGGIQQSMAYGAYYGLNITAYDRHSHDNGGWGYVTLSTPENVIGEDNLAVSTGLYDSLYAAAI